MRKLYLSCQRAKFGQKNFERLEYLESRVQLQKTSRNWHVTYAAERSAIFATLFDFVCKRFASVETENSNPDCEESESKQSQREREIFKFDP